MKKTTFDYLIPEWPAPDNVQAAITLRSSGSSCVPYNHFNIARKTYNELARAPRSNSYLNLGMGAGFLEYYIENHGKINIESVEWIEQTKNFSILLKKLNIELLFLYLTEKSFFQSLGK